MENQTNEQKTITLPEDKFKQLLDRIQRLEAAANKAQLSRYDSLHTEVKRKLVNLLTIDGKVVLSWDTMNKNLVEKNPLTGVWHEDQVTTLHLEGEEKPVEMQYVIFTRRYQPLLAEVVNENIIDGETILKVKTTEGKEYEINAKFVN